MESVNSSLNFDLNPIINTFKYIENIELGEKRMVEFDDIAREMYNKITGREDFNQWKRLNRSHIIRYFETTCQQKNIICQECKSGPLKGNFWICKKIPQEMLDSIPN